MEEKLKKRLVETLRRIALAIEKGLCDKMTDLEYDDLIESLNKLKQIEETYKPKVKWKFF